MSVRRAQREISAREFSEWLAYGQIEPWGEQRADMRNALVCCILANAHRGKNQAAFKVDDFMPEFDRQKPSPEALKQKFEALAKLHNAKVKAAQHGNANNRKTRRHPDPKR